MSRDKHTVGPWIVQRNMIGELTPFNDYGQPLLHSESEIPLQERDANAALIAAAPDLLELAQQYASECAECDGGGYVLGRHAEPTTEPCSICADIRAVIAKATLP